MAMWTSDWISHYLARVGRVERRQVPRLGEVWFLRRSGLRVFRSHRWEKDSELSNITDALTDWMASPARDDGR